MFGTVVETVVLVFEQFSKGFAADVGRGSTIAFCSAAVGKVCLSKLVFNEPETQSLPVLFLYAMAMSASVPAEEDWSPKGLCLP